MSGYDLLNLFTGLIAIGIAYFLGKRSIESSDDANRIADDAKNMVAALTKSQIDEKLATFAAHLGNTNSTLKYLRKNRSHAMCTLNEIRRVNSDFNAVSDLRDYADDDEKDKLITIYIIPILKNLYSLKKIYQGDLDYLNIDQLKSRYESVIVEHSEWNEWNGILTEMTTAALNYNIQTEEIRNFTL